MAAMRKELLMVSPFPSTLMKIEEDNFLLWKSQILPTLKGHDLEKFVIQKKSTNAAEDLKDLDSDVNEDIDYWIKQHNCS